MPQYTGLIKAIACKEWLSLNMVGDWEGWDVGECVRGIISVIGYFGASWDLF